MKGKNMTTQKTPQDFEIPVPKRKDVFKVLEEAAKPIKPKPSTARRRPNEVASQTARPHRRGDCTAKHTRSGSLEDA